MHKHILIIGFVWPEPKSSAAGSRMMQLISSFKNYGYEITFATPCAKSDNAFNLSEIGWGITTTLWYQLSSFFLGRSNKSCFFSTSDRLLKNSAA